MAKLSVSRVIQGDCLEVMESLEDNSIDACVDDPPYALGFMGKEWDSFKPKGFQDFMYKVGKAKLRILKPGAYNLSFSGTRTYHRLVCGLEDAGFFIKDQLIWCYGSGFPKSLDISKAIDDYYGLKREKGKEIVYPDGKLASERKVIGHTHHTDTVFGESLVNEDLLYESIPNSEEAQKWYGWGTGLKPAFEPIVVAQKPYEKTYAENVLKYGVGGLNIDGCRIATTQLDNYDLQQRPKSKGGKATGNVIFVENMLETEHGVREKGRFPANLLLTHHPECKLIGSKKVGSGKKKHNQEIHRQELEALDLSTFTADNSGFKANKGKGLGNYGIEEVESWHCHPECPIRMLDEQSGETKSSKTDTIGGFGVACNTFGINNLKAIVDYERGYIDKGGASRFFYCGKAHKSERNAGLDNIKAEFTTNQNKWTENDYRKGNGEKTTKPSKNNIATLKPINVMRYLVRLVTPPNGLVLDCFAGSGTTGIACILEGFNYILIEKRKRFAQTIIPKRLEFWKDPKNWSVLKDHNALPKIKRIKEQKQNVSIEKWF